MSESYGMISVVSGKVTLNAAGSAQEFPAFLESTSKEKGFEVCFIFERFTGKVIEMRAHPELKWKLRDKKKLQEKRSKEVEAEQVKEVEGWKL